MEMGEMEFEEFLKSKKTHYDKRLLKNWLILAKNGRKQYEEKIFFMLVDLVIKNVNNFFKISKGCDLSSIDKEGFYAEGFIILNKCISKFNIEKIDLFIFYFNTSLSRGFLRLREKLYLDRQSLFSDLSHVNEKAHSLEESGFSDFIWELNKSFTDLEIKIIISRLQSEKIQDFLQRSDISIKSNEYYEILKTIKSKSKGVYDKQ